MITISLTILYCLDKIEDTTEKDIMKMRNYIKKKLKRIDEEQLVRNVAMIGSHLLNKKVLLCGGILLAAVPVLIAVSLHKGSDTLTLTEEKLLQLASAPMAATSNRKDVISIPQGTTKANPFLPYRDISGTATVTDVPAFTLVEPPEILDEGSDAARVMDTVVSGILFDKFSPSAILNIEGNDYLVKKGDTVNNYKVVDIMQDSVTVKLGSNVYKAGIGEILTEGSMNRNEVPNLKNKFGGERRL